MGDEAPQSASKGASSDNDEELQWSEDEKPEKQVPVFEPYRDDPIATSQVPDKAEPITKTTELSIDSEGSHTPMDLMSRSHSPNIMDDNDATGELQTILSQQYASTPSASSSHSRRQSYSFSRKPTPEPELPFDFNRFQEQLRTKSAEPVAKYLKSFLHEFNKRQWNSTEQQKIVRDFLDFIRGKMLVYEPFKSASEAEFDNAHEGMEKLIMNRLYPDLFPPLVVAKVGKTVTQRLGHSEDLDRDRILSDKIKIYSWVREPHLDLPSSPSNDRFLSLAGIEISKLDQFRAPRDKIICILNCCKVIFGLLRNAGTDESADKFIPLLILTLLKANVQNLCSHVSFIQNFRNPDKLSGEAGYYLSSLQGAINFLEALDRQSLTISDEEYEENVESAVRRIKLEASVVPPSPATPVVPTISRAGIQLPSKDLVFEKATGLLNIAKPSLSAVGRLFSHEGENDNHISDQSLQEGLRRSLQDRHRLDPTLASTSRNTNSNSRSYVESGAFSNYDHDSDHDSHRSSRISGTQSALSRSAPSQNSSSFHPRPPPPRSDSTRQPVHTAQSRVEISEAEANAANAKERQDKLDTLSTMFENVEIGVIEMVLDAKQGKIGASIDTLLEIGGS